MSPECRKTGEVVASLRFGDAAPSVQAHLDECAACRAAVTAGQWIRLFRDAAQAEVPSLPDPRRLLATARLQRAAAPPRSRLRIMDILQGSAYAIAAIAPAVWFALRWPDLLHWVSTLGHGESSWLASGSSPVLWTAVALGGIMTLVTLQLVFAEE